VRLGLRREDDDGGLVLPEVVEEELAEPLAIDRRARRAALVELVDDAPDRGVALALAIGEAEVRVAQAVFAQVLAGAVTTTLAPLCVSRVAVCSASCIARPTATALGGRSSQLRPACAVVVATASAASATRPRGRRAFIA
jgi:hypothetical protein